MAQEILAELNQGLRSGNPARLEYTRKAFRMLPKLDNPRILDVGCGRGDPTLELARLSGGEVIGVDISQPALDELARRIQQAGWSDRVRVLNRSMLDMDFPAESFDIIWAEGAVFVIGFERSIQEWRRFLKPNGFLVIHEMTWLCPDPPAEIADHWRAIYPGIRSAPEYIQQVPPYGYEVIGHLPLPEEAWWLDYYGPLETRIRELREKYAGDSEVQRVLDNRQREVDLFKKHSRWYGSAFYVMQKKVGQEIATQ
jgi:SAM-dependent methyltransferase